MAQSQNTIDGNLYVRGVLKADAFVPPNNAVGNTQFNAADPLEAGKQVHQYAVSHGQARGTAAVAERRVVHAAFAAGQLLAVGGGVTQACVGDATVTLDVYKNGASALSSTITLDSGVAAFDVELGTIAGGGAYAVDDVFEVVASVNAGTGTLGQGVFVRLVFREAAG